MSNSRTPIILRDITLEKFVHGGQCIALSPEGKKLFVWGGLPGERVDVQLIKKKSSYLEGVVVEVVKASSARIAPLEPKTYLSNSPWQILNIEAENEAKQAILEETFIRAGVTVQKWTEFYSGKSRFAYRNKQEFGFWGDDNGLHLAQYVRGTHGKQIVESSALAHTSIQQAAQLFMQSLREWVALKGLRATDLKTVVFRCSTEGEVVAALFIKKDIDCSDFKLPNGIKGVGIYYSNPKSPASILTKELYVIGDIKLIDTISGKNIIYDVHSFFQVNIPVFEVALTIMQKQTANTTCIDLYSGVGTIGIAVGAHTLVELDDRNIQFARENTKDTSTKVIHASSEDALNILNVNDVVILDPPRAGLHRDVITQLNNAKPPKICYLSCNPVTQARDIAMLQDNYRVSYAQGFNFFPTTPHIESLVVLERV